MRYHGWWMIRCCLLPLMIIFLLPVFGVRGDLSIFFFILLMFVCHLMMMGGHRHHQDNSVELKTDMQGMQKMMDNMKSMCPMMKER